MNKNQRDWLESIGFSAIIVTVLFLVFWPFSISGDSMMPSFYNRDRIVISRISAMLGKLDHGDFVVCRLVNDGKSENVLKRVVGIPGDEIKVSDNQVFVNGDVLQETYLKTPITDGDISLVLSDDEYFVLGDNRAVSYDSRITGAVKSKDVIGKVLMRWYPFSQIRIY